jgi:hypothetical protein
LTGNTSEPISKDHSFQPREGFNIPFNPPSIFLPDYDRTPFNRGGALKQASKGFPRNRQVSNLFLMKTLGDVVNHFINRLFFGCP